MMHFWWANVRHLADLKVDYLFNNIVGNMNKRNPVAKVRDCGNLFKALGKT